MEERPYEGTVRRQARKRGLTTNQRDSTLILNFWPPVYKKTKCLLFKPPSCGSLSSLIQLPLSIRTLSWTDSQVSELTKCPGSRVTNPLYTIGTCTSCIPRWCEDQLCLPWVCRCCVDALRSTFNPCHHPGKPVPWYLPGWLLRELHTKICGYSF